MRMMTIQAAAAADEDNGNVNNIIRRNKEDDKKNKGRRRSRLPPHFAESLPTGLVLAGGVNADDHEETFASLAKFLAKSDFHCGVVAIERRQDEDERVWRWYWWRWDE